MKSTKKTLLIGLFFLSSFQVIQSQVLLSLIFGDNLNTPKLEFGLNTGFNVSNIRGIEGTKSLTNFELGFYFDYLLKKDSPWYLKTGVYVKSNVGARNIALDYEGNRMIDDTIYDVFEDVNGTVTKEFNTFYVPINIRYMSKSGIFAEAGIQMGLVFKTKDIYTAEVDTHTLNYEVKEGPIDNGLYNWFDGGFDGGLGYKSKGNLGWKVGIYYYIGVTNLYKKDTGLYANNSSLYFLADIPIGKKKAEERRASKEQ